MRRIVGCRLCDCTISQVNVTGLKQSGTVGSKWRGNELNDPVDIVGHWAGNPEQRRIFKTLRDVFHDTRAILCMSTSWQEPLLWGHYADKHKGLCLGFDVPEDQWMRVKYVPERSPLVYYETPGPEHRYEALLSTKFQAWEYEREYRAVFDLKEYKMDPVSGHYFAPFTDTLTLKEVIAGDRCPVSRAKLADVLGSRATEVLQKKARPSFIKFEVVEQRRRSLWK